MRSTLGAALLLAACGNPSQPPSDGSSDAGVDSSADLADASLGAFCESEAASFVYAIDARGNLLRFDPATDSLLMIGRIDCPTADENAAPFSMAIGSEGIAFVLHDDGSIGRLDLGTLGCAATARVPGQGGFVLFGMAVAHRQNDVAQSLWIAGGDSPLGGNARLGALDLETMNATAIGELPGWSELSVAQDGALWGFLPETTPPSIQRINPSTAQTSDPIDLPTLLPKNESAAAWAFVRWGSRFYIFLQSNLQTSSDVFRVSATGETMRIVRESGFTVMGAGVPACPRSS